MTIQTLTSNPLGGADLPGLPDLAALGQLANAFFQALPGEAPVLPGLGDASQLHLHDGTPNLTPSVEPGQFTSGAPAAPASAAPQFGRSEAPILPAEFAPALPLPPLDSLRAPGSQPSSPYYFIGEASAYPSSAKSASQAAQEDRVTAQPFALPGQVDLAALFGNSYQPAPQAQKLDPGPAAGQFYFLEPQAAPRIEEQPVAPGQTRSHASFDVHAVRRDFPILAERVNGKPLIWLDNAATTQKPQAVIDRLSWFYQHENSNIHRAAHELAARATDAYEGARNKIARFLGAKSADEIVFVRGATEAINLVANTFGRQHIGEGDEIIVSILEHHANIVP